MASPRLVDMPRRVAALLDALEEVPREAADDMLAEALDKLEALAVELTPVETGNLEASTVTRFLRTDKQKSLVGELAFVAPYAAAVHELPQNARGPRTRRKPGNELGQAGPKFVERALRGMQKILPGLTGTTLGRVLKRKRI